jgi:Ca2+-binding EF-hand superfamily protein
MPNPTEAEVAKLRAAFDACDTNGDGYIDQQEFLRLLQQLDGDVSPAECELDLEFADTEGDGYIGFKEFMVWWTT